MPLFIVAIVLLVVVVFVPSLNYVVGGSARGSCGSARCRCSTRPRSPSWRSSSTSPTGSPSGAAASTRSGRGTVAFLVIAGPVILLVLREPDIGTTTRPRAARPWSCSSSPARTCSTSARSAGPSSLGAAAFIATHSYCTRSACARSSIPWSDPSGHAASTRSRACSPSASAGCSASGLGREPARRRAVLPNAYNDFIFAIIGEEFGLIGGGHRHRPVRRPRLPGDPDRAGRARTRSGRSWPPGITAWICVQAFINIGVVVALLPVTGITLPFVSAGGSSLVISFAAVGILLSISRETVEKGTWNDASADRGRGNGRAHLPGPGRRPVARASPERRLSSAGSAATAASSASSSRRGRDPAAAGSSLRSLRTTERDVHLVLDPIRLGASRSPRPSAILVRQRPAAIFTTGGYIAIPVLMAAAPLRIPVVMWEGNVIPGRSVRATARLADVLAVSLRADVRRARAPGRPCYVTGTPIRDLREHRPGRGPGAVRHRRRATGCSSSSAARRRSGRFNAAVAEALPRLVERVHVVHVTGDAGYAAALAGREALPAGAARALPAVSRSCATTWPRRSAAADLVVGRAGSSTLAEVTALGLPMVVVPYPARGRPPAGQRRGSWPTPGPPGSSRTRRSTRAALLDAAAILDDPAAHARDGRRGRSLGRPGAADAVAELVLASAERRELPDTRHARPPVPRRRGPMTER